MLRWCLKCKVNLVFVNRLCGGCHDLQESADEVDSDQYVRCPGCRRLQSPDDYDAFEGKLYDEGEHEVDCEHCDCTYTVTTVVSRTYTSPSLVKKDVQDHGHALEDEA